MIDQPSNWSGIFFDIPAHEYHGAPLGVATAGGLKLLKKTPAHYYYAKTCKEDKRTKALDFGKAYHSFVLEPETFDEFYAIPPADAPRRPSSAQINAKNPSPATLFSIGFWDEWNAANAHKTVISDDDFEMMKMMKAALLLHPMAAGILANGKAETTFRWIDERTGLQAQCRPDWWVEDGLDFFCDLKTCEDASHEGFGRAVAQYEYHVGHCHYADGARHCGKPIKNYLFLIQEKTPPYLPALRHIDAAAEERGWQILEQRMNKLAEAVISGVYAGYSNEPEAQSIPGWAFYD